VVPTAQAVAETEFGLRAPRPRSWRSLALRSGSVTGVILIWQALASQLDPILFPTPLAVVQAFVKIVQQGVLVKAVTTSVLDVATGFGLALVIGIGVGILMGRYRVVEELLDPYVSFFNATPMVALIPLVIIWFGLSFWARVFFVLILAVWSILVNTVEGIKNVNRGLMEVGVSFGLSEAQIVRSISIPGAVPYILAGARVGMGKAIIGMIIGEYSIALAGLGGLAQSYGDAFQTAKLLAVIVCTSLFGVASVVVLQLIQARVFPWISGVSGERR
jgi:ABC-type nitrate/sulfonate/bicarbonate transport system permease component